MEYNILDFSGWKNHQPFQSQFRKIVEGLNLFYKRGKSSTDISASFAPVDL